MWRPPGYPIYLPIYPEIPRIPTYLGPAEELRIIEVELDAIERRLDQLKARVQELRKQVEELRRKAQE